MMGCSTTPARNAGFFGGSHYAYLSVVPGGLHGAWQANWADVTTSLPLDLTPGAADTGGSPAPAKTGKTKTLLEPAPGGSVTTSSPQLLPDDCPTRSPSARSSVKFRCSVDFTVSSSAGDLKGTTIVAEGGVLPKQSVGEAVAACWLIGPETLPIDPDVGKELFEGKGKEKFDALSPHTQLSLCLVLLRARTGTKA